LRKGAAELTQLALEYAPAPLGLVARYRERTREWTEARAEAVKMAAEALSAVS